MIHIGSKIKEVFKSRGITAKEFGKRITTSRENVYGIFNRESVDTKLLVKISKALDHNFFQYYITKEELYPDIEMLEQKIEAAEKEIAYLRKINNLMEKEILDREEDY